MALPTIISQRGRLVLLVAYVVVMFLVSRIALGAWVPPTTQKGLWFYSGLAALLLGNLIVTPFFTKPADSLSYSVAALIALLAVHPGGGFESSPLDQFLWSASVAFTVALVVGAILSIVFHRSTSKRLSAIARALYVIADEVGSPRVVFSEIFLFAVIAFHRGRAREFVTLMLAWAVLVARPIETGYSVLRRISAGWVRDPRRELLGEIVGHQIPGIVLIRHDPAAVVDFGDVIAVRGEKGQPALALSLDHVGVAGGRWLRAIELRDGEIVAAAAEAPAESGDSCWLVPLTDLGAADSALSSAVARARERVVGLVAPETDTAWLRFEVVRSDRHLEEGRLVEVQIDGQPVLYQILNGRTREEIVQEKNTRGYVRVDARKVGCWNQARGLFESVHWIPNPNALVLLAEPVAQPLPRGAIGCFPDTSFPVTIDPDLLVTHNGAILGILGVGKSFLALELVERMIEAGIRVICLDMTNQYAEALAPYLDDTNEADLNALRAVGPEGKEKFHQNVEEGGSSRKFKVALKTYLEAFLSASSARKLAILNPVEFDVWRQDSKMYSGRASMASLTPTEITRIIVETTLEVLQTQGMTSKARCCIVFEEAHSLIPEWNAVASEGDKTATNGTAKAILQGRKYGLGCLVITQRTANVTKSILNQCNTVFALRVFDATGMEFLSNYIGADYSAVLSTLHDRQAVAFGKASSCNDPILLRLNDRQDFLRVFRAGPSDQSA